MTDFFTPPDHAESPEAYDRYRAECEREDAEVRRLIAAPLTRYHAQFFAARVVHTLLAVDKEPLGATDTHVRYLVRAAFMSARRSASIQGFAISRDVTQGERARVDMAAKTAYRFARNQCRRDGISVSRQRLPGGTSRQRRAS